MDLTARADQELGYGFRYFTRVFDSPARPNHQSRVGLYRYMVTRSTVVTEWRDPTNQAWEDYPDMIAFTGLGGDNDYLEIDREQAAEMLEFSGSINAEQERHLKEFGQYWNPAERRFITREEVSSLLHFREEQRAAVSEVGIVRAAMAKKRVPAKRDPFSLPKARVVPPSRSRPRSRPKSTPKPESKPVSESRLIYKALNRLSVIAQKQFEAISGGRLTSRQAPGQPEIVVNVPVTPVEVSLTMPDYEETQVIERDDEGFISRIRKIFKNESEVAKPSDRKTVEDLTQDRYGLSSDDN